MRSNLVTGNRAARGGGLACCWFMGSNHANNTVCDNHAVGDGGGVHLDRSSAVLVNWILWGNTAGGRGPAIHVTRNSMTSLAHGIVQGGRASVFVETGGTFFWATAMSAADPRLVDAANGDYHLRADSPCIDRGDGTAMLFDHRLRGRSARARRGPSTSAATRCTRTSTPSAPPPPGGTLTIKVAGPPQAPVFWGFSFTPNFRSPPARDPRCRPVPARRPVLRDAHLPRPGETVRSRGLISLPLTFPVPMQIPIQALIGTQLSKRTGRDGAVAHLRGHPIPGGEATNPGQS